MSPWARSGQPRGGHGHHNRELTEVLGREAVLEVKDLSLDFLPGLSAVQSSQQVSLGTCTTSQWHSTADRTPQSGLQG